jgi:hypothetical protein
VKPLGARRRSTGQALVEFALVASLMFFLFFAIIEFGRFILYYHTLNNAVREGARYAIVHGSNSNAVHGWCESGPPPPSCDLNGDNVKQAVAEAAFGLVDVGDLAFPPVPGCSSAYTNNPCYTSGRSVNGDDSNKRGSDVTILVTFTYPPVIGLIPPITITAESTLVINN